MNNWNLSKVWTALILSILMAVSSCGLPYCKKTPFSNNDLDWMKPYSVGDTLIFFNRENIEFDTLIVTKKTINNPTNKNIFDMEGYWKRIVILNLRKYLWLFGEDILKKTYQQEMSSKI